MYGLSVTHCNPCDHERLSVKFMKSGKKYLERRRADLATALDQPSYALLVHVGGGVVQQCAT